MRCRDWQLFNTMQSNQQQHSFEQHRDNQPQFHAGPHSACRTTKGRILRMASKCRSNGEERLHEEVPICTITTARRSPPWLLSTSATFCIHSFSPSTRNTKTPRGHCSVSFGVSMPDFAGNRDFLAYLRDQGKFFDANENRELDLTLIDHEDLIRPREQWRNVYEVTEECARVIDPDGSFCLDNSPTAFGGLPCQCVAGQGFSSGTLPHKSPDCFLLWLVRPLESGPPSSPVRPRFWGAR